MGKKETKERLKNSVVAIIRCEDSELAENIAITAIQSGITAIEVTYTVQGAAEVIANLRRNFPEALIGAGTVLETAQAAAALAQGAEFIVTPCIREEVGVYCREHGVFCSMAATTSTEVYNSHRAGSDVVKLFPGEFLSPSLIKALKGPFPFIDFMPTGGITHENIKEWFERGAFAVGAGGYLTKGITLDNLDLMRDRCRSLLQALV